MPLHTHLNFGGNCEEAFNFYAAKLDGKILMMMRQSESPQMAQGSPDSIIHARLALGGATLMGNDVPPNIYRPMRSVYLFLSLPSPQEAERAYAALVEGGEAFGPLVETFFATRFGQVRDQFGVSWTIIHEKPAV